MAGFPRPLLALLAMFLLVVSSARAEEPARLRKERRLVAADQFPQAVTGGEAEVMGTAMETTTVEPVNFAAANTGPTKILGGGNTNTNTKTNTNTNGGNVLAAAKPTLPKTSDGVISKPLLFGFVGWTVLCITVAMVSIFKSG